MWQDLIDTLDKLGEVYDDLAKLGEKKRSALINVDMKGLSDILDAEQSFTTKIQNLEQKRIELFKDLSKSNINLSESTTAKDLYRSAPSLVAEENLIRLHERLVKNVQRTLKLRDDNQVLAQCALDSAQMKLNKLGGAMVEPTYSGKGAGVVTHQQNFDFKA